MIVVTIYTTKTDNGIEDLLQGLRMMEESIPNRVVMIDIESDNAFFEAYKGITPVVQIGPYQIKSPFTMQEIRVAMGATQDRAAHLEKVGDDSYSRRIKHGSRFSRVDNISYWLSKHYMILFNLFFFLYTSLPFAAPVLLKNGYETPANAIYSVYGALCHELAFRSWFLFGEQAFYPRSLAGIDGVKSYEMVTGSDVISVDFARTFTGNETLGYKVALCQRDIGIYGSIFLFGVIFSITGRKIKPISWYWWLIIGLTPIAIDGVSQLPGIITNLFPDWIPIRESTPLLRTLTGGLFGTFTAWYLYPLIEESMAEIRSLLYRKKLVVNQSQVENS